ncbi:MAG: DUF2007 domain-containing protein [Armatimonadetes bacterium]|nr:DUF2007 domain-containing protein [Armatimonadota bacterium]
MTWKKLTTAHNDLEAEMIGGLLRGAEIPFQRRYKSINQYLKIIMGPVVAVEIWVPEEQLAEALALLESFSKDNNGENENSH